MIRFACPGCNATFSVGDEKAGKTGKCPKCQSQFVIPEAEGGPAPSSPPPPPPPVSDDDEIAPCPGCQARLSVSVSDLGVDVECPYCKTVYKAKRPGATPQQPKPRSAASDAPSSVDADRPSRPRRPRDDEEEAPRSHRRDRDDEDDDTRPSRRRRDEDEDDDDDGEEAQPRRKKKRRRNYEPHRGTKILIFGLLGFFCCPIIFGLIAINMANVDLEKMDNRQMDPEGAGLTKAGKILGIVSIVLGIISVVANVALFAIGK